MTERSLETRLSDLASRLVDQITQLEPSIREGTVMTIGPVPYRRLDCEGRALAYVRVRPRKRAVRVDVSGLWSAPSESVLSIPSSNGSIALVLKSDEDLGEAVAVLRAAVRGSRAMESTRLFGRTRPPT